MQSSELPVAQAGEKVSGVQSGRARAGWLLLSFWGGLQIMLLEVSGFRVLQTNLGSSVWVTGTLLTVIMIVLAAGYYLGGVLSHAVQTSRVLLLILLASVAYTYVVDALYLEAIADFGYGLREQLRGRVFLQAGLPAVVLSFVLYGPPVLAMSMISPFLIRLESERIGAGAARTGRQSGFFMSLSTAGSIVGTLLASYVLVPMLGVRATVVAASGAFLLLLVALLLSERRGRWELPASVALLALAVVSVMAVVRAKPSADVVYETESFYGNIRVVRDRDAAGRTRLSYRPSRVYTHSVLYPDEPLRELVGTLYLLPALMAPPRNILVLGSAAGGVLRQAERLFPQAELVGVDLDPAVHEAAVSAFDVDPVRSKLVADDARAYLASSTAQFDHIIVDLFSGEFIPSHCITKEFFQLVKQRLAPGGSVFINTNMSDAPLELVDDEPFLAFRHLVSTLRQAGFESLFENLHFHSLYAYPSAVAFASFQERLAALHKDRAQPAPVRAGAGLALRSTVHASHYGERYRPFTDEWAPDMLIELRSNKRALFEAYAALGTGARARARRDTHPVAQQALAQQVADGALTGDYWALSQPEPLVRALNDDSRPLVAGDRALAARYLHFGDQPVSNAIDARTPWAQVATLYARMYAQAYANDYELLLETLDRLEQTFASAH